MSWSHVLGEINTVDYAINHLWQLQPNISIVLILNVHSKVISYITFLFNV